MGISIGVGDGIWHKYLRAINTVVSPSEGD